MRAVGEQISRCGCGPIWFNFISFAFPLFLSLPFHHMGLLLFPFISCSLWGLTPPQRACHEAVGPSLLIPPVHFISTMLVYSFILLN